MSSKNTYLQSQTELFRFFKYTKGDLNLDFKLDVENKAALVDFLEMLEKGAEDVKKELAKFNE